jgi:hypothetical protein
MKKFLALVGVVLLGLGVYQSTETASFLSRALSVPATVTLVEGRTGSPKPTQNTPVHVTFKLPSGEDRSAITNLPLLQNVKAGDTIYILIDPARPEAVKLPLLSELWARPLAYLISGFILVCGVLVVKVRKGDFSNSPVS